MCLWLVRVSMAAALAGPGTFPITPGGDTVATGWEGHRSMAIISTRFFCFIFRFINRSKLMIKLRSGFVVADSLDGDGSLLAVTLRPTDVCTDLPDWLQSINNIDNQLWTTDDLFLKIGNVLITSFLICVLTGGVRSRTGPLVTSTIVVIWFRWTTYGLVDNLNGRS